MAFKSLGKTGDFPQKWEKEKVPTIIGKVLEYKTSIMGKPGADAIIVKTDDGIEHTVWIDKVMRDYVDAFQDIVGTESLVKITYTGKAKGKSGFEFNTYKVEIDDGAEDNGPLPF